MVRLSGSTVMKNDDKNKYDSSLWEGFAVPGQVVAYILGGAALGLLAGHVIDDRLHSSPIATFIGLLLGLAAGVYAILRFVSSLK
jgi:F0F1-type ATP synthase assembly protein I